MASLEGRVASSHPAWLVQAWQLWRADIFFLCGQESRALGVGHEAVGYPTPSLHSFAFAGAFARWLALCADTEEMKRLAAAMVKAMLHDLERLDALDRAEIVCANSIVGNGIFERGVDEAARRQALGCLPPPVAVQLRRLGVLRY